MKAICDFVNFDLFMVLPRPTAQAVRLEFSSKDRSKTGRQVTSTVREGHRSPRIQTLAFSFRLKPPINQEEPDEI
jgi:hypothetical protein